MESQEKEIMTTSPQSCYGGLQHILKNSTMREDGVDFPIVHCERCGWWGDGHVPDKKHILQNGITGEEWRLFEYLQAKMNQEQKEFAKRMLEGEKEKTMESGKHE